MSHRRSYRIIAHRGASAYEPENTLRAFRRAIELGADMSELDVHLSHDGHLVVLHNGVVATPGGEQRVVDLTLTELQALDMGAGERIPTLQEVIDLVRGRGGLYIELKGEGTARPVADALRAHRFIGRDEVIVGSFQPHLVQEVKTYAPEIATSLLVGPVLPAGMLIAAAQRVGAGYLHLCWERRSPEPHRLLTPDLLSALHAAGLGIILWHEERPGEIAVLRTLPVEGICSNAPDLLL